MINQQSESNYRTISIDEQLYCPLFVVAVERSHEEAGLPPGLRCLKLTWTGHSLHTCKLRTLWCSGHPLDDTSRAAGSDKRTNGSPRKVSCLGPPTTLERECVNLLILGRTSASQQRSARSQCRAPEMRDKRGASAVPEHSPGTKQSLHVTCEAIHQRDLSTPSPMRST